MDIDHFHRNGPGQRQREAGNEDGFQAHSLPPLKGVSVLIKESALSSRHPIYRLLHRVVHDVELRKR